MGSSVFLLFELIFTDPLAGFFLGHPLMTGGFLPVTMLYAILFFMAKWKYNSYMRTARRKKDAAF